MKILKEVINRLELFTAENPGEPIDLKSFILWLNSNLFEFDHSDLDMKEDEQLDMESSLLLVMQNKHYKFYTKKALGNSAITSAESFSFLYHLNLVDSYRKMELVRMHLLEPPSGIEILKRLLKKGLIEEFDDLDDKRAKRIRITDKGQKEIKSTTPHMQMVFKTMTAEMSLNEKLHLIALLRKMNTFHMSKRI